MTILELRIAIHNAVDKMPEDVLPEILDYINNIQQVPSNKNVEKFIDKVFEEDDNLLRRLAQ